jgi:hypothetical protein
MLTSAKMSQEFTNNMEPVNTEAKGINNFADAFENYFYESTVATIPVNPGCLAVCSTALKSAMVGASSNAGTAIQNGITAFWSSVATVFLTIWTTVPPLIAVVPPVNLATINASLQPVFTSNKEGGLSKADCWNAISAVLHPLQLGGIAKIGPAPGVDTPIL